MGLDNPLHIAFLLVIMLLVFGAKRLPEMGKSLGSGMRGFKDAISGEAPAAGLATSAPVHVETAPAGLATSAALHGDGAPIGVATSATAQAEQPAVLVGDQQVAA